LTYFSHINAGDSGFKAMAAGL